MGRKRGFPLAGVGQLLSLGIGQQEVTSVAGSALWHHGSSTSLGSRAASSTHVTALMEAQEVEIPIALSRHCSLRET